MYLKIWFLNTGDVVCSKCQHIFSFSVIEFFFTKSQFLMNLDCARNYYNTFLLSKHKKTAITAATIQNGAVLSKKKMNRQ